MDEHHPSKGHKQDLKEEISVKPIGLNPMVSTFQRTARALRSRRSMVSDADGFGVIWCRHIKYQPYIQMIMAVGIMKMSEPNISMRRLVRCDTAE